MKYVCQKNIQYLCEWIFLQTNSYVASKKVPTNINIIVIAKKDKQVTSNCLLSWNACTSEITKFDITELLEVSHMKTSEWSMREDYGDEKHVSIQLTLQRKYIFCYGLLVSLLCGQIKSKVLK